MFCSNHVRRQFVATHRQEIILHIGHSKTGSSFIQSSLALSQGALRAKGIEYPEHPKFSFEKAKGGGITSGNLQDAKGFVGMIIGAAERYPQARRLAFSSETLFPAIVRDVRSLAVLQDSFDVTVVLFTREFLGHALSILNQGVKRHAFVIGPQKFLAHYAMPLEVLQALEAIEQAGCRVKILNYSRHADHLLESFSAVIGVASGTLVVPPVARINRSLDTSELYLARRLNAVIGNTGGLLADPLCEHLPLHPVGVPRIARQDYEAFRERMAPLEAKLNQLIPHSERYGIEEPIVIYDQDPGGEEILTFSTAQIDVLAKSLGSEIVRLRSQKIAKKKGSVVRLGLWARVRSKVIAPFVYKTLAGSSLFDAEWYLQSYPDVKAAGIDPLLHYCTCGHLEFRNPSDQFDACAYLMRFPEVLHSGLNPLYHYLRYGKRKGLQISGPKTD